MAENVDKPTIDGVPLPVRDLALKGRANAEAGVSVAEINASMGSNYEESITVSEGCDRDLPRGKRLVMYPSAATVFFEKGKVKGTAFMPTGVECQVVSDW